MDVWKLSVHHSILLELDPLIPQEDTRHPESENDEMSPAEPASLPWVVLMQVTPQTVCNPLVNSVSIAWVQGQVDDLLHRGNSTAGRLTQFSQYTQLKHAESEYTENYR